MLFLLADLNREEISLNEVTARKELMRKSIYSFLEEKERIQSNILTRNESLGRKNTFKNVKIPCPFAKFLYLTFKFYIVIIRI